MPPPEAEDPDKEDLDDEEHDEVGAGSVQKSTMKRNQRQLLRMQKQKTLSA
jgi:hypothetical protein